MRQDTFSITFGSFRILLYYLADCAIIKRAYQPRGSNLVAQISVTWRDDANIVVGVTRPN